MKPEEEFLEAIIDTLQEGVVVQKKKGEIVFCNQRAGEILQVKNSELAGKTMDDLQWKVIKESGQYYSREELPSTITWTTGESQKNIVAGLILRDGTQKWLNINTRIIQVNREDFVLISFSDITMLFSAHEKVRINEERLNLALNENGFAVWEICTETGNVFFSEGWYDLTGYPEPEVQKTFAAYVELIHPSDRDRVMNSFYDYLSGRSSHYEQEYRVRRKEGSWRWILSRGKIVKYTTDGRPALLTGIYKDIGERKERENELKINQRKFLNAFHYSAIGMALVSPEGNWIDVNDALLKLIGYRREELLNASFQAITHPDDLEADLLYVGKMLRRELSTYTMEKRYFHKDGHIVWTLLTVSLVFDSEEEPQFFISQIIDISFLKGLINELENKNQLLKHATVNLENKISQMEEFSRIVAHNLRGPVANILTLTEMLHSDPENAESWITMLGESAKSLDEVLHDLISIVQIRLNKNIAYEECNIHQLITRIKIMFNAQLMNGNIQIKEELALPVVFYPPAYMDSILYNLISNAIKYRNSDIITEIKIKTYQKKQRSVLEVQDNGIGIDLERYGKHLFKLHKTFHKGYDSKGVGLYITKTQIESLGGRIFAESKPGEGSVFRVEL